MGDESLVDQRIFCSCIVWIMDDDVKKSLEPLFDLPVKKSEGLILLCLNFLRNNDAEAFFQSLSSYGKSRSLKNAMRGMLLMLRKCLQKNLTSQHVSREFEKLGFSSDNVSLLAKLWKAKKGSIVSAHASRALKVHELVDMEWKFGVTTGSDELEAIGATFLQIKLTIRKASQYKDIYMELSLPQFYDFLRQMERAMDNLKALE